MIWSQNNYPIAYRLVFILNFSKEVLETSLLTFSPCVKSVPFLLPFLLLTHLPVAIYVFYDQSSLVWHFSALKPSSKLPLTGEHSFQVNIQAVLPDVQLTKSITVQYFWPVLPPADHYDTQGFLTSQWKLVKIIGYIYFKHWKKG